MTLITTPPTSGGPIVVAADGSGDYASIDAAVLAVDTGKRISVRPGTYQETVVLDRSIEIVGDGPTDAIILIGPGAAGLWSMSTGSIVRGLTIRLDISSGGGIRAFDSIWVADSDS